MAEAQARVALFLDAENFNYVAGQQGRESNFEKLLQLSREQGLVVLARAYADWSNPAMRPMMTQLHKHGVLMEQLCTGHRGKNTADMQLAVDALEMCLSDSPVETVIIVSGDRDMVPLVHKLRRRAMTVIGVGFKNSTGTTLSNVCTQFYFYEDFAAASGDSLTAEEVRPSVDAEGVQDLMTRALDVMESRGSPLTQSGLNTMMRQLEPTFSHQSLGFATFGAFLSAPPASNLVELKGKSGMDNLLARKAVAEVSQPTLETGADGNESTPESLADTYQELLRKKGVDVLPYADRCTLVGQLIPSIQLSADEGMSIQAMNGRVQEIAEQHQIERDARALSKVSHTMNIALCFARDTSAAYEQDMTVPLTLAVPDAEEALRKMEAVYVGGLLRSDVKPDPEAVALWLYGPDVPNGKELANLAIKAARQAHPKN